MEKNVGGIDRTGRIVVDSALAIAGIAALTGYWAIGAVIGVIGVVVGAVLPRDRDDPEVSDQRGRGNRHYDG